MRDLNKLFFFIKNDEDGFYLKKKRFFLFLIRSINNLNILMIPNHKKNKYIFNRFILLRWI